MYIKNKIKFSAVNTYNLSKIQSILFKDEQIFLSCSFPGLGWIIAIQRGNADDVPGVMPRVEFRSSVIPVRAWHLQRW